MHKTGRLAERQKALTAQRDREEETLLGVVQVGAQQRAGAGDAVADSVAVRGEAPGSLGDAAAAGEDFERAQQVVAGGEVVGGEGTERFGAEALQLIGMDAGEQTGEADAAVGAGHALSASRERGGGLVDGGWRAAAGA